MIRKEHITSILRLVMVLALLQLTLPTAAQPWGREVIKLGENVLSCPAKINALPRSPSILTRLEARAPYIKSRLIIKQSPLRENNYYFPKTQGLLESYRFTRPDYTTIFEGSIGHLNPQINIPYIKSLQHTPVNDNKWWIEYIGGIIDEQMIRLGIDKMEKQLFKNGINIDTELEDDTVGFIIYNYEYKLDAA